MIASAAMHGTACIGSKKKKNSVYLYVDLYVRMTTVASIFLFFPLGINSFIASYITGNGVDQLKSLPCQSEFALLVN